MFESKEETVELFDEIDAFLADSKKPKLLTDNQVERLILSLAHTRGEAGFDEEECVAVVRWAESTVVAKTMLDLVLDGDCDINWKDNDVLIGLSDLGKERLEQFRQDI